MFVNHTLPQEGVFCLLDNLGRNPLRGSCQRDTAHAIMAGILLQEGNLELKALPLEAV